MPEPATSQPRRGMPLHTKILLGLVLGAVLGVAANAWNARLQAAGGAAAEPTQLEWFAANVAEPLGRVFLRLVLSVVVPLVFSALVLGVLGLGDVRRLGRIGVRSLLFTVLLSGLSVFIGLSAVNLIRPGDRLAPERRTQLQEMYSSSAAGAVESAKKAKPLSQILLDLIPENPLQEMVGALDGSSLLTRHRR